MIDYGAAEDNPIKQSVYSTPHPILPSYFLHTSYSELLDTPAFDH